MHSINEDVQSVLNETMKIQSDYNGMKKIDISLAEIDNILLHRQT